MASSAFGPVKRLYTLLYDQVGIGICLCEAVLIGYAGSKTSCLAGFGDLGCISHPPAQKVSRVPEKQPAPERWIWAFEYRYNHSLPVFYDLLSGAHGTQPRTVGGRHPDGGLLLPQSTLLSLRLL